MTRYSTPLQSFTTTLAVVCFSLGVVGAMGADAVDRQVAIHQARAAAENVNDQLAALDDSLARAQDVATDAQGHRDDEAVIFTTASLTHASEFAAVAAREELGVDVTGKPAAERSETHVDGATMTSVTPARADVAPVDVDAIIAADSTEALRAEAERLVDVSETIDAAVRLVDARAAEVEEATQQAALATAVSNLDEALARASDTVAHASEVVAAVGYRVPVGRTLADVPVAVARLNEVTTDAVAVDRSSADAVRLAVATIAGAQADVDEALNGVAAAHLTWVDDENQRRAATNERLMSAWQEQYDKAVAAHAQRNRDAVSKRPNGWKNRPTGVSGSNGRLSSGSLCALSFDARHRLQCDAARALEEADAAYFAETGHHLALTDSYRSYALQARTRALKPRTAARAGTSNHGWGMAIDLYPAAAAWLRANGEQFGWVHPRWARPSGSLPESWHLEYVGIGVGPIDAPTKPVQLPPVTSVLPDLPAERTPTGVSDPEATR